ncbi:hypothetical protein [Arthrobacter pigmenti]
MRKKIPVVGSSKLKRKEHVMAGPFIFIGTHILKEGQLENFKQYLPQFIATVEAHEPRLIHFGAYFNEEGTEVSFVQVHPDSDSMEFHMQVVKEHVENAYVDYLAATKNIQIYGTPSEAALAMMSQLAGSGVSVGIKNEDKGFSRLPEGELA